MNKMFSKVMATFKAQYVPVQDDKVKMTMDGTLACPSHGEYRAFVNGELTSIPEELLIDVPMYRISKPIDQVKAGDIIKTSEPKTMKSGEVNAEGKYTYRMVTKVEDGKISTITFGGTSSKVTPVKDFFFGQKTASVVVNLFGGTLTGATGTTPVNNMNPMMLMVLMGDKGGKMSDMLPFLLMQQGGQTGMNPMMLMALAKDGDSDISDILLFSVLSQNGGINLANLFGGAPAATTQD